MSSSSTSAAPLILVVDDEPRNLRIVREYLEDSRYDLVLAQSGEQAWQWLQEPGHVADVILLDRMMPGLSGMEVLQRVKCDVRLNHVPVIMQTAMSQPQEIADGIKAGAHYYLTKPFDPEVLLSVVASAVAQVMQHKDLIRRLERNAGMARTLASAHFRIRTLDEAADLAAMLAAGCRDEANAALAIVELLINSIEHGNLGLDYQAKGDLIAAGQWREEIERRLADPAYRDKFVDVFLERSTERVRLRIVDQGQGFDWTAYQKLEPARAFDVHGRGIALASAIEAVSINYVGCGSEVHIELSSATAL